MSRAALALLLAALLLAALLAGCEPGLSEPREKPSLDLAFFRCEVQPVLVGSCGQLACHGNQQRFFRVMGRNRFRPLLGGNENRQRSTPLSEKEIQFNYDSALGYVDVDAPDDSYLLRKPLDQAGGGFYHGGATEFGKGDVFLARDDAAYETIRSWIAGAAADPACVEPGVQ